jgi:hypothetical protein
MCSMKKKTEKQHTTNHNNLAFKTTYLQYLLKAQINFSFMKK